MKLTKFFTAASLFLAFAFLVALFIAGFGMVKSGVSPVVLTNGSSISGVSGNGPVVLNSVEVAKHNNANDCWMIVNGKVYDLTSFASQHSGGSREILQDCGKDGSAGYNTKYGQGSHRQGDVNILAAYYVGNLV